MPTYERIKNGKLKFYTISKKGITKGEFSTSNFLLNISNKSVNKKRKIICISSNSKISQYFLNYYKDSEIYLVYLEEKKEELFKTQIGVTVIKENINRSNLESTINNIVKTHGVPEIFINAFDIIDTNNFNLNDSKVLFSEIDNKCSEALKKCLFIGRHVGNLMVQHKKVGFILNLVITSNYSSLNNQLLEDGVCGITKGMSSIYAGEGVSVNGIIINGNSSWEQIRPFIKLLTNINTRNIVGQILRC